MLPTENSIVQFRAKLLCCKCFLIYNMGLWHCSALLLHDKCPLDADFRDQIDLDVDVDSSRDKI